MTQKQKMIKNIALIFALLLAIQIIVSIVTVGIKVMDTTFGIVSEKTSTEDYELKSYLYNPSELEELNLNLAASSVNIKKADDGQIKVDVKNFNNRINFKVEDKVLKIKEDDYKIAKNIGEKTTIDIYIPDTVEMKEIKVQVGAAALNISDINAYKLKLELGAGKARIENVKANIADIDTGVGESELNNVIFDSLDLDTGVGSFDMNGTINEKGNISAGVGSLKINLLGDNDKYMFDVSTGIGTISINDEVCKQKKYGDGDIEIKLDGGIGEIEVQTRE